MGRKRQNYKNRLKKGGNMTTASCRTKTGNGQGFLPAAKHKYKYKYKYKHKLWKRKEGKKVRGTNQQSTLPCQLYPQLWLNSVSGDATSHSSYLAQTDKERDRCWQRRKLILDNRWVLARTWSVSQVVFFYQLEAAGMSDKGRKQKHNRSRVFPALLFLFRVPTKTRNNAQRRAEQVASGQWQEQEQRAKGKRERWAGWIGYSSYRYTHAWLSRAPYLVMFFCHCCTHGVLIPPFDRCRRWYSKRGGMCITERKKKVSSFFHLSLFSLTRFLSLPVKDACAEGVPDGNFPTRLEKRKGKSAGRKVVCMNYFLFKEEQKAIRHTRRVFHLRTFSVKMDRGLFMYIFNGTLFILQKQNPSEPTEKRHKKNEK